ncbi:MAG: penicillin-insensitive murein endopeptidase [Hyalangium sp.]|uniref:LysM peptidoglycan-binding domain-containing protein n=1 Tax=Hyalangium sp. TaxID=2028555 RepID=UPI00389A9A15
MRFLSFLPLILVCAGCAAHVVPNTPSPARSEHADATGPAPAQPATAPAAVSAPAPGSPAAPASAPAVAAAAPSTEQAGPSEEAESSDGEADDDSGSAVDGFDSAEGDETESAVVPPGTPEVQYTTDLSDEELKRRWKEDPASLGSVSVGFVHSGRMVNSVRFPDGHDWTVVSPEKAWTTTETVNYLTQVIHELRTRYPNAPLLRVNQISTKDGGYIRPHKSHQNGRDVDLGFYYPGGNMVSARAREKYIDLTMNWALVKALVTLTDVQLILVDRRVQKVLYDYALKNGEDKAWLDSLFHAGQNSLIMHARGHRDHFHVRFFNPRAQELGRRLAPLLAMQPEHNIAMHRVRSGDTLGAIALRYNSSVNTIRNVNRIRGNLLHIGEVLSVPLRGPCTRCPVPPPVVVPARHLPALAKVDAQPEAKPAVQAKVDVQPETQAKAEAPAAVQATVEASATVQAKAEVPSAVQPPPAPSSTVQVKADAQSLEQAKAAVQPAVQVKTQPLAGPTAPGKTEPLPAVQDKPQAPPSAPEPQKL